MKGKLKPLALPGLVAMLFSPNVIAVECESAVGEKSYSGEGQLYSPVQIKDVDNIRRNAFFKIQQTEDSYLVLNPNNSFFPRGEGFKASNDDGTGSTYPDSDMRQNKNFLEISQWRKVAEPISWPLMVEQDGDLELFIELKASAEHLNEDGDGSTVRVLLVDQESNQSVESTCHVTDNSDSDGDAQWKLSIPNVQKGYYYLSLIADNIPRTDVGTLKRLTISGQAASQSSVVRARWRPAAVHASFSSSYLPSGVDAVLTVMEIQQLTEGGSSYSPVTTPFGYYGSTFTKQRLPSGFNFSLWAFGKSDEIPEFIQMPHLLSVGDKDATYSWFGHEGTGVKFRDFDPYENNDNPVQIIGYSTIWGDKDIEVGEDGYYHHYSTYFYDHVSKEFRLFGTAHDVPNASPRNNYSAFVEVPGPADVERTGNLLRTVAHKGWILGSDEVWYPVDTMTTSGKGSLENPLNKNWTVDENNSQFLMHMGDLFHYASHEDSLHLSNVEWEPDYLEGKTLDNFVELPLEVEIISDVVEVIDGVADIEFSLNQLLDETEVTLYWETENRLSYLETMSGSNNTGDYHFEAWDPERSISLTSAELNQGVNIISIEGLDQDTKFYFRIYGRNINGQTFSKTTGKINFPIVPDGYNQELVFSRVLRNFQDASDYCADLGGELPSKDKVAHWRGMYSTSEHEQHDFQYWNWTSTPLADGRVPYRSLYTSSGGAVHQDALYGTLCYVPNGELNYNLPNGYEGEVAFSTKSLTFPEAEAFCSALEGELPTSAQITEWRNMYSTDEHLQQGFEYWNWTSTPTEDGKVPYRSLYTSSGGRDSITNYYGAICKVDRYKIRGATLADGYDDGLVYDTAMTKRTFIEATEYCESLGGALPTTSQFSTWRNMYTKEEHERYGFHTWNWTSTPKEDGTVPYRSLYTGSGGAASPTSKYGTICHVN